MLVIINSTGFLYFNIKLNYPVVLDIFVGISGKKTSWRRKKILRSCLSFCITNT